MNVKHAAEDLQTHLDEEAHRDNREIAEIAGSEKAVERDRTWVRRAVARWRAIVAALLLLASAGLAAGLYFGQYRIDQATSPSAASVVISAASEGTVAVLSYKPDTLETDLAAAKAYLHGEFSTYHGKFTDEIVGPVVKDKGVSAAATVVRAAVSELHPDTAKVLVFLNQTTTSKDRTEPTQTASSVLVELTKVGDKWKISALGPV